METANINNHKTTNNTLNYSLLRAGKFYHLLSQSRNFSSISTISPDTPSSIHQETVNSSITAHLIFSLCAHVLCFAIFRTISPVSSVVESISLSENFHLKCIHCSAIVFFSEVVRIFYSQNNPTVRVFRHLSEKHRVSCPSRSHIQAFLSEQVSQPTEEGDYSCRHAGSCCS